MEPRIKNPKQDRSRKSDMSKTRIVVICIFLAVIGWLYFSPPSFDLSGGEDRVTCRALGAGFTREVDVLSDASEEIDRSRVSRLSVDHERLTGQALEGIASDIQELSVAATCNEARMNRQTDLFLVVVAGFLLMFMRKAMLEREAQAATKGTSTEDAK